MSKSKESRARTRAIEARKRPGSLDTTLLHDRPFTTPRRTKRKLVASKQEA